MVKNIRVSDEKHSKLKELQEELDTFSKPHLKDLAEKSIDLLYQKEIEDE